MIIDRRSFSSFARSVCALALGCLVALTGCLERLDIGPARGLDAGTDVPPTDRVRAACAAERNRVLFACNVPNEILYLGDRQVRIAQIGFYSCGVRVTPRMVQLVLGRDPFPGTSFHGLVTGSAGTSYFPNMAVFDGMRGGMIPHRVTQEYDDSRVFRIEPMPLDIQNGESRVFYVVADIADREDRPWELVGPEFRVGITPWFGTTISPEGLEITDYATGSRIPATWLREAPWSSGCIDPHDFFTVIRPSIPRSDAGR